MAEAYRRLGFAVVDGRARRGVLRGRGAVVSLADGPMPGRILESASGQYVSLEPEPDATEYPVSKMGAVAVARQAFLDALWWRDAEAAYAAKPSGPAAARASSRRRRRSFRRPRARRPSSSRPSDVLALLRAERVAKEMKLKARYVGAGDEYRLLRRGGGAAQPDLVLRVDFPQPDKLDREEEWLDVPLERLRAFDRARIQPAVASRTRDSTFSFTTAGLDEAKDFPQARPRGDGARSLGRRRARRGHDRPGAASSASETASAPSTPGKIANLVVETGEPFAREEPRDRDLDRRNPHEILGERDEEGGRRGRRSRRLAGDGARRRTSDRLRRARPEPVAAPSAVVVRGATVWTQGSAGVLENADVLVVDGKIAAVGKNLAAPAGAVEVDGRGKHVTPGIIDAHSHTAVDGDVNEGTHNVTAEVRIRDVLNPLDVAIYRELAGGTTVANVLHGSANAIGGQNQIVKWRWGARPRRSPLRRRAGGHQVRARREPEAVQLVEPAAALSAHAHGRRGARSASGSRPRGSTAGARTSTARPPRSRARKPIPPEPDLQLEAIAEILEGKRKIHCHSYRKDEILQMLRSAEEFGVKVATLQHVLEGYKVADEIARHGAGASGFSDWWAYKFEVYDAIPYAFRSCASAASSSPSTPTPTSSPGGSTSRPPRRSSTAGSPGRRPRVRDVEPGEAARDRGPRRLARGRQGRRLRRLERRSALDLLDGSRDLDRRARSISTARRISPRARALDAERAGPGGEGEGAGSTRGRPRRREADNASERPAVSR